MGNNYEYRFEVLPVDAGVLTVELVDAAGSKIIRQTNPKTFKANTRSGVNVVWDDATVNIDDKPLTWYDDYAKNGFSDMGANSVYVKGAKIRGVGIENVKVIGVRLRKLTDDGQETGDENITYHPNPDLSSLSSDENGTLSFDSQLDNIPSGNYYVRPYAIIINSDGAEQEIISTVHTAIVTGDLDIIIRSSYNNNGTVAKTNDLNGDKIYVSLKDAFAAKNLTASSTFHYGNNDPLVVTGSAEFETGSIAPQQYSNCYAEIELKNGYKFTTQSYTVNVTGIPYSINFTDANPNGWNANNCKKQDNSTLIKKNEGYLISPRFFAAGDYNDIYNLVPVSANRPSITRSYSPTVYVSVSDKATEQTNIYKTLSDPTNGTSPKYSNIEGFAQITTQQSSICIYAKGNYNGIDVAGRSAGVNVEKCEIKYKL